MARAVSKATEVTPVKWYQGKELFLWPAVLSSTKKSRWLERTCILNDSLLHCSKLRCLCFTWGGLPCANGSISQNSPEVLEDALDPLVHNVSWRETDRAVPQKQAVEGDHISWEKGKIKNALQLCLLQSRLIYNKCVIRGILHIIYTDCKRECIIHASNSVSVIILVPTAKRDAKH